VKKNKKRIAETINYLIDKTETGDLIWEKVNVFLFRTKIKITNDKYLLLLLTSIKNPSPSTRLIVYMNVLFASKEILDICNHRRLNLLNRLILCNINGIDPYKQKRDDLIELINQLLSKSRKGGYYNYYLYKKKEVKEIYSFSEFEKIEEDLYLHLIKVGYFD